jgi:hypothetical protein
VSSAQACTEHNVSHPPPRYSHVSSTSPTSSTLTCTTQSQAPCNMQYITTDDWPSITRSFNSDFSQGKRLDNHPLSGVCRRGHCAACSGNRRAGARERPELRQEAQFHVQYRPYCMTSLYQDSYRTCRPKLPATMLGAHH